MIGNVCCGVGCSRVRCLLQNVIAVTRFKKKYNYKSNKNNDRKTYRKGKIVLCIGHVSMLIQL